ncbi:MAG TPA: SWIM zinc finger family protein [Streptosporangiaceae bacterium]
MAERWDRARVLALAPDASAQRAARSLASGPSWPAAGAGPAVLWGECRGSASVPYQTVVDLAGPAYRCSCPSRKFPCKHALALLLLWADGTVPPDAGEPPGWAAGWLAGRETGAGRPAPGQVGEPKDPKAAARRAGQREARVASGLAELDRWLCDQVRQGLAVSQQAGYGHWDDIAARMVDAQASGVAERLRGLAAVPHSGPGWDGRLLEEYALLRLLTIAYRRQDELPPPLRETVRSRVGFSLRQADVLARGEPVRDHWQVLGRRDTDRDRVRARRTWLHGRTTGRPALVLSFAPTGADLDDTLTPGTDTDADLVFYPGAVPLRAIVAARHDTVRSSPPDGDTVTGLLAGYAAALAQDPWLDSWPAVLEVTPSRSPAPAVSDPAGDALPLHPEAGPGWTLLALSGGHPVTVAGEWTPRGLWPLTAWDEGGRAVPL